MPIIVNAVREVLGETAALKIATIPHSNNTTKRRIEEMSSDIQFQLKVALNSSPYFSLQFDESVDVSGAAQLLCYVKYIGEVEVEEKMLFCFPLSGNTTGECLFEAMMKKTQYFNLDWDKCVAICTDGAVAMTGRKVGFMKRILDIAPNAKWSHCMIHRYSLAVKPLPDDLTFVMEDCVSIINHIKTSSLKTRLFEELCTELGANFVHLLYHTQVRWLSRGKVLNRLVFLKDEAYLFLCNDNSPLAHKVDDQVWICRMCYSADVFALVNEINTEMQEFDAFPLLKAHSVNYPPDALTLELFTRHLRDMHILIGQYFPPYQEYENEWVISPFNYVVVRNTHLETSLQFALMDLSCNMRLKSEHSIRTSSEF
ncbi:zinc finger BED domain-containing protein 5-like [Belonocnema kinseyi]|uniref:zinc finger BED domain-containing protein 5-like n=1 Tax=Belonocnema kinseyi TaxID=2817044 RepID=UPI00143DA1B3|nr:zinc finger BED domain-containing protein 5-like [Belonocnema kinseyi]